MSRSQDQEIIASTEVIKNALTKAENSLDQAIADAAAFTATMSTERARLGVAFQCGQDAIAFGTEGLSLLTASRAKIAAAHDELAETGRRLGVPAKMLDGLWGKPKVEWLSLVERHAA